MGHDHDSQTIVPTLLRETDVAGMLHCSRVTVARERRAGRLGYVKVGKKVFFTNTHVAEYIESQSCHATRKNSDKSAIIGFRSDQTRPHGAVHGLTAELVRSAERHLAQSISKKPKRD
jgi:hypothetical protein